MFVTSGLSITEMAEAVATTVVEKDLVTVLDTLTNGKPVEKAKAKKVLEESYSDFGMTVEQGNAWLVALQSNGVI